MSALAAVQRELMATLRAATPPAAPGLAVYHRTLRANWQGALAAAYPVVHRLVGERYFAALAEGYAAAHPSRSGDLHDYGGELAAFIDAHEAGARLDYLADVARLEWAVHESLDAADAAAFDFSTLAAVAPGRQGLLRPRLHPAARLLRPRHDVVGIWEANQPGRDGTPATPEPATHVLVMRAGFEPRPQRLAPADGLLLEQVARGATLDECCAALGAAAPRLGELLARHAAGGTLCGFDGSA